MIERHAKYTRSERAQKVLQSWEAVLPKFVKVLPKDYHRMVQAIARVTAKGLSGDDALMAAFEENAKDESRLGGG